MEGGGGVSRGCARHRVATRGGPVAGEPSSTSTLCCCVVLSSKAGSSHTRAGASWCMLNYTRPFSPPCTIAVPQDMQFHRLPLPLTKHDCKPPPCTCLRLHLINHECNPHTHTHTHTHMDAVGHRYAQHHTCCLPRYPSLYQSLQPPPPHTHTHRRQVRAAEPRVPRPEAQQLHGVQLIAVGVRRAGLRAGLLHGEPQQPGAVGGAVRRLRQRSAGAVVGGCGAWAGMGGGGGFVEGGTGQGEAGGAGCVAALWVLHMFGRGGCRGRGTQY